ncbi:hypothetical protein QR98_0022500 [Sarcoptes scabiei]|uniref:Carbohydrate kinase PfkB domain-containing protein n=1 Tax=Sarcoptes scabiei TaxID=52283 RepID=A0A131ZZU2_SARSC|nr:hypothetical protein QR98_0022500 [Sarcoptes scabiei]
MNSRGNLLITKQISSALNGSTYDGTVHTSFGGVGRNIADSINRLGTDCLLITAVGHDLQGRMIAESISKKFRVKNPYDYNKITKIDKLSTVIDLF